MPKSTIKYLDYGLTDYGKAWEMQQEIFNRQVKLKTEKQPTENHLIFVEHPHVYTLGKSATVKTCLLATRC